MSISDYIEELSVIVRKLNDMSKDVYLLKDDKGEMIQGNIGYEVFVSNQLGIALGNISSANSFLRDLRGKIDDQHNMC